MLDDDTDNDDTPPSSTLKKKTTAKLLAENRSAWNNAEANKHHKGESTSAKACKKAHCLRVSRARLEIEAWDEGEGVVDDRVA